MTSFFHVLSYCHLSATLQTISINVESSCVSNFYRTPNVSMSLSLVYSIPPDDRLQIWPKHVEFDEIKSEQLVLQFGFHYTYKSSMLEHVQARMNIWM